VAKEIAVKIEKIIVLNETAAITNIGSC